MLHDGIIEARNRLAEFGFILLLTIIAWNGSLPLAIGQDETWSQERITGVLSPPTPAEINSVLESWSTADNEVADVVLVESGKLTYENQVFDVLVFKYDVNSSLQYSACYVPVNSEPRTLPILVAIRGVRFDYPSRDITNGPFVMSLLGDMIGKFIIVEPCLRGHELKAIEQMHRSDGDRRDSYDGAAHDAIRALSVATSQITAWDQENAISFGLSRGGGVALLHGQRDRRINGVVALSAPTDWMQLMARADDDWPARIHEMANSYTGPTDDRAAQFFEWFLQDRNHLTNQEIRHRLIASSPLYFAERLPPTLVHQGTHDKAVPCVNAAALSDRFLALELDREKYKVIFHEGSGHLLRESNAAEQSVAFLKMILQYGAANPSKVDK